MLSFCLLILFKIVVANLENDTTSINASSNLGGLLDSNLTAPPTAPDFVQCSVFYGSRLGSNRCSEALTKIFPGRAQLITLGETKGPHGDWQKVPLIFQDVPRMSHRHLDSNTCVLLSQTLPPSDFEF